MTDSVAVLGKSLDSKEAVAPPALPVSRRPESVLVVVHTPAADVLLLKRRDPFAFWQSVTGSLDAGELHATTAVRELFEETGFRDEGEMIDSGVCRTFTIDPRWLDRYPPGVSTNQEHAWTYRVPDVCEVELCLQEHTEYRWVPIDEAIEMVWSWTNKDALERLRRELS